MFAHSAKIKRFIGKALTVKNVFLLTTITLHISLLNSPFGSLSGK